VIQSLVGLSIDDRDSRAKGNNVIVYIFAIKKEGRSLPFYVPRSKKRAVKTAY